MNVEKLVSEMNDGKLINATEGVLLPMFLKHEQDVIDAICGEFRTGKTEFTALVAKLSYIREILDELKRKKIKGNLAYKKLQGDN